MFGGCQSSHLQIRHTQGSQILVSHMLPSRYSSQLNTTCSDIYLVLFSNFILLTKLLFLNNLKFTHIYKKYQRSHVSFTQFSPMITYYKTIVQQHNQDIDTCTICQSYSDVIGLTCIYLYVHVYLVLCNLITHASLYIHHHSQKR